MNNNKYTVLSLGWGVQSFTLAAMVALDDMPMVDAAIHADTTHEFSGTYKFAEKWTPWLVEHGVKVVITKDEEAAKQIWDGKMIPAYTNNTTDFGQAFRVCTQRWKIAPMRRWIQANRDGKQVEQWIGISWDESQRMKNSDVQYITNRWPLLEKRMTRNDCRAWLVKHNLEVPPRSACTFCPYHDSKEWQNIKASPTDWEKAVGVDRAIRKARPPYDLFVHPSRKPLEQVDLRSEQQKGQLEMWDSECSGVCFI